MLTQSNILQSAAALLNRAFKKAFQEQGHTLTGGWERSVLGTVKANELKGEANFYGGILNAGTTPGRIPFGGKGSKKTGRASKYIQGLISYWKLRGLSDKEAIRAAFATAHKQKVEGMPTAASNRFSATGKRTAFVASVEQSVGKEVDNLVLNGLDRVLNETLKEPKVKVY